MVTFDQFKQMDLRIGKIVTCEDHPNADKLYLLSVDIGGGTRKLVAGIKGHYSKDELINKKVVVIANLETATIRGVQSEGMVLATKDKEKLALLIPEKDVEIGSPIS